jgi:hypothetical protein
LAYYLCHGPTGTGDEELIRVAGTRWAVEELVVWAAVCPDGRAAVVSGQAATVQREVAWVPGRYDALTGFGIEVVRVRF